MNIRPEVKIQAGFAVALAVVLAVGFAVWKITAKFQDSLRWSEHSHEVLGQVDAVDNGLLEMQAGFRGFLIDPGEHFESAYREGSVRVRDSLAQLRLLTQDNPQQAARISQVASLVGKSEVSLEQRIAIRRRDDLMASLDPVGNPKTISSIRKLLDEMRGAEQDLQASRELALQAAAGSTIDAVFAGVFFAAIVLGGAAILVQRDIRLSRTAAERIEALNIALKQQNRQLEAANHELEAFSYSVSHDLRAPLRHVDGFASMLAKRGVGLDETSRRYVETISSSARRMGRLIDDLLSFSRMGRAPMALAEIDSEAMIAGVIAENDPEREACPIEWRISPLPRVQADQPMLRQVWANLIGNAIKYTGRSPQPRIEIGADPGGAAGREHIFYVRDNGVGFDMRYASNLFGVFHRLHGDAEFKGTGIGLAIVRRIVARHGGRTWAEGRVGEGASFYFSLPAIHT